MKLKLIVLACGLSAIATSGMAATNQDINQQISKLQAQVTSLQQKVNSTSTSGTWKAASASGAYVSFDRDVSSVLNSTATPFGKQEAALDHVHGVVLGGYLRAAAGYEKLSKSVVGIAQSRSKAWLADADLSVAAQVAHGLVGFVQVGQDNYIPYHIPGTGQQNQVKVNDVFLAYALGDDMYVAAGKGDVAFGDMTRVNAYASPLTRFFNLNGNYAMFGMNADRLHATVSVLNGGGFLTGGPAPTGNANQINNIAVNVKYALPATDGFKASVGVGYENASQFGKITAAGGRLGVQTSGRNAAYDVNAEASMQNLNLVAEYITTADNMNKGTILEGKKASAWNLGASYKLSQFIGNNAATVALSYGQAKPGEAGLVYKQLALSATQQLAKGVDVGLEYNHQNFNVSGGSGVSGNALIGVLTTSF